MDVRPVQAFEHVPPLLQGLEAHARPGGHMAADPLPVLLVMGDHGGDVIQRPVSGQRLDRALGQGGFAVFAAAGKEYPHTV